MTPCPDGQIIDHRDPVPADQVVERVIRASFVQTPCQVQVPVCVKVPVPQEVSSTQGVAAVANAEQIVEDLVQVSAQGSDTDNTKCGEYPCPAEQTVQCRVSAPVKQIAADAPVFVEQVVDESVRVPVRVTKKGTAGP